MPGIIGIDPDVCFGSSGPGETMRLIHNPSKAEPVYNQQFLPDVCEICELLVPGLCPGQEKCPYNLETETE